MNTRLWLINDWPQRAQQAKYRVKELALQCETPASTLRRFWRKRFGNGPKQWLLEMRMSQACIMLEEGTQVKSVAHELGYGSRCHFAREFSAYHGYPPSEHVRQRRVQTG